VKRAARRPFFDIEVVEEVVHDLLVVEADLGQFAAADRDDFVNVARLTGVRIGSRASGSVPSSAPTTVRFASARERTYRTTP
jgi:hypothetical protein